MDLTTGSPDYLHFLQRAEELVIAFGMTQDSKTQSAQAPSLDISCIATVNTVSPSESVILNSMVSGLIPTKRKTQ